MNRKWTLMAVVSLSTALVASTASLAANDDEGPLHVLMEKVNKSNGVLRKGTRNAIEYKKTFKKVEEEAKELAKLGKEARPLKDAITSKTPPHDKWVKLADEFIKASEDLATIAAKGDSQQVQAKEAFNVLTKTCTNCHNDYKVEE